MNENPGGTPSPFQNNTNSAGLEPDNFNTESETEYSAEMSPEDMSSSEITSDETFAEEPASNETIPDEAAFTSVDYDDSVSTMSESLEPNESEYEMTESSYELEEPMPPEPTTPRRPASPATPNMPRSSRPRTMDSFIRTSRTETIRSSVPNDSTNFNQPMPVPMAGGNMAPEIAQAPIETSDNFVAKDSIVGPAKKKSKGGLVAGIILLIIALGCGIAAIIMFVLPKADDRVEKAITKLIEQKGPSNLMATGKITLTNSDPSASGIASLTVNVDSKLATAHNAGESTFDITANLVTGNEIALTVNEVHSEAGDLYLKVSGLDSIIGAMTPDSASIPMNASTNCVDDLETNCLPSATEPIAYEGEVYNTVSGIFEVINNQWLRIPKETLASLSNGDSLTLGGLEDSGLTLGDNASKCLVTVMTNLGSYGKEIGNAYQKYPFITYSTDDLKIQAKKDTLYRLGINDSSFASFLNSLPNSNLANDVLSCAGLDTARQNLSVSDVQAIFSGTPIVYVEINDNYNVTRVYFDATTADTTIPENMQTFAPVKNNAFNIAADFSISYPTAPISVTEPGDYIDVQEFLQNLLTETFGDLMTIEE